jgi:uncharacterized iron-regulated membrane protein
MSELKSIKKWFWWHRWTSLICTLFLLLLCLTGLPLIFTEEINHWVSTDPPYTVLPKDNPPANLNKLVNAAYKLYPGHAVSSLYIDEDEPQVWLSMIPNIKDDPKFTHTIQFDARTGAVRKDNPAENVMPKTFMDIMFALHVDLFMELPGELFLGFMGILFVISIISGVVLYGPFMKKLDFGTVRSHRSSRLKWLDLHNLLGIATTIWLLVVGLTGVFNDLSTPLFGLWQITDVKTMLDSYKGKTTPKTAELSELQGAFEVAQKALPGMEVVSIVYPGNMYGSPYHYLFWAKGNTALTSRLFSPVLVDARSGKLAAVLEMPFYLRALEVSRPLHFGDYGGTPLKIIWALFDLAAIVVLISGVYLWIVRRKFYADYFLRLTNEETAS